MDLVGVVEVKYQGQPILGLFHGKTFVWPDPWTDIWDEGSAANWDGNWHDMWTPAYVPDTPAVKES
jgi:hypothetical protein